MHEMNDSALGGAFMFTGTDLVDKDRPAYRHGAGRARSGAAVEARDRGARNCASASRSRRRLGGARQFVAGIAHELNNPLQGVLGHLELLRE